MKKISLPYFDHDGTMTAHVVAAMAAKQCTSAIDPEDSNFIVLTFAKAADAKALLTAIGQETVEETSPTIPDED